jgi:hypothetical protein
MNGHSVVPGRGSLRINEMPRRSLRSDVLASEGPRENSIVIFQFSYGCHEQQDMAANHDSLSREFMELPANRILFTLQSVTLESDS